MASMKTDLRQVKSYTAFVNTDLRQVKCYMAFVKTDVWQVKCYMARVQPDLRQVKCDMVFRQKRLVGKHQLYYFLNLACGKSSVIWLS